MNVVFLTGNQPRHMHMARTIAQTGALAGLVVETREAHVPEPPPGIPDSTTKLFIRHFADRAAAEDRFFSAPSLPDCRYILHATARELNSAGVHEFIRKLSPGLLLSYGCHKLSPETLALSGHAWNIHGGLSPRYRGVITHFWPSYMLEPQMTGMTVHLTTRDLDAGDVVQQSVGELIRGDGIHDLACRTVAGIADELGRLFEQFDRGAIETTPHRSAGKLWTSSDWRPAHLHSIYDLYENRIVDRYLDGDFGIREPALYRQE